MGKLLLVGALATGLFAMGCGDDTTCGDGTVNVDGVCVPADDACGAGTSLDPATGTCVPDISGCATGTTLSGGECVPDGSVVCETGTTFDTATGTCVADITGCATGTVLVAGECVPFDDTLTGDVMEPAEPNGNEVGATAGQLALPAVGSSTVIEGCIGPRPDHNLDDNPDADVDYYIIDASAPALVEISVDGVGGMAGAFFLVSLDPRLSAQQWLRQGLNLLNDTTQRQVYLPVAGSYLLAVADTRSLFFGTGVGDGVNTCYFASINNLAVPTPTAMTGTSVSAALDTDAQFYSYTPADGDTLDITLDLEGITQTVSASVVTLSGGSYVSSAFTTSPANDVVTAVSAAGGVTFVVEQRSSVSALPVSFDLDLVVTGASALGTAGTPETVTLDNANGSRFYFDAAADDMVRFRIDSTTSGDDVNVRLLGPAEQDLGVVAASQQVADVWAYLPEGGRYVLEVTNDDSSTGTANVDITRWHVAPTALSVGTPVTGVTLGNDGHHFYKVDFTAATWLDVDLTPTGFGGAATVGIIGDPGVANAGILAGRNLIPAVTFGTAGFTGSLIVQVRDDNFAAGSGQTFDLAITNKTVLTLTPTEDAPVNITGISIPSNGEFNYLISTTEWASLAVSVTAPQDLQLTALDLVGGGTPVDSEGAGGAEQISINTGEGLPLMAISIQRVGAGSATAAISVSVNQPEYLRAVGFANPTNACDNGTRVDLSAGFSAAVSLGIGFNFFGVAKTDIVIGAGGLLTFDTSWDGSGFPQDAIGVLSGLAMTDVEVCVDKSVADRVVVQWQGIFDGDIVSAQAVLRDNDVVHINYSANMPSLVPGLFSNDFTPLWLNEDSTQFIIHLLPVANNMQLTYTPRT